MFKKNEDIFLLKDAVSPFRGLIYAIYHWPGRGRQHRPHTRSELALAQPRHRRSCCNGAMGCNQVLQSPQSPRWRAEPGWQAAEQDGHLLTLGTARLPRRPSPTADLLIHTTTAARPAPLPGTAPVSSAALPSHLPLTCSAAARPALHRRLAQLAGKAVQLRARTGLILLHSSLVTHV